MKTVGKGTFFLSHVSGPPKIKGIWKLHTTCATYPGRSKTEQDPYKSESM